MKRINLFLLVLTVGSALWLVHLQYERRLLGKQLADMTAIAHQLDKQHDDLSAQRDTLLSNMSVDALARQRLAMREASLGATRYVQRPAQPPAQAGGVR